MAITIGEEQWYFNQGLRFVNYKYLSHKFSMDKHGIALEKYVFYFFLMFNESLVILPITTSSYLPYQFIGGEN